jgi:hypothetical protein
MRSIAGHVTILGGKISPKTAIIIAPVAIKVKLN